MQIKIQQYFKLLEYNYTINNQKLKFMRIIFNLFQNFNQYFFQQYFIILKNKMQFLLVVFFCIQILQYINCNEQYFNKTTTNSQKLFQDKTGNIYINPFIKGLYPQDAQILNLENNYFNPDLPIFQVQQSSVVDIAVDFRHLKNYTQELKLIDKQFDYGIQWDLILVYTDLEQDITDKDNFINNLNEVNILGMPDQFLEEEEKFESHQFSIFLWKEYYITVLVRILDPYFVTQGLLFMNTTSLEVSVPNRAQYGDNKLFLFVINNEEEVNLPVMVPLFDQSYTSYPNYFVSYYQHSEKDLKIQTKIPLKNNFIPNSIYWKEKNQIVMPYVPYFSNCRSFGQYIYFFKLTEQNESCNYIEPENTKPVDPIAFSTSPKSDQCFNVQYECVYDDLIQVNAENRWFEVNKGTILFYITQEPQELNHETISSADIPFQKTELIPVKQQTFVPQNKMPKDVYFTVNYYQVDKVYKRLIESYVELGQFIDLQENEKFGENEFTYTLHFNLLSMNHSSLINQFAFNQSIYFILFLGVGLFSIIEIIIFYIYHWTVNRFRPKPKFQFLVYLKPLYRDQVLGFFMAIVPMTIILALISVIMLGSVWKVKFQLFEKCNDTDICKESIFDYLSDYTANTSTSDIISKRNGRTGVAQLILSIYIMYSVGEYYIPIRIKNKEEQIKQQDNFGGNNLQSELWKRSYFVCYSVIITLHYTISIIFSFSNFYATNLWVSIITIKLIQILIEYYMQLLLDEDLLLAPLQMLLNILLSLATMGASTFYDFLISFFVMMLIMMIERSYIVIFQDWFTEYVKQKFQVFVQFVKKIIQNEEVESDEEDKTDMERLKEIELKKEKQKQILNNLKEKERLLKKKKEKENTSKGDDQSQEDKQQDQSSDQNDDLLQKQQELKSKIEENLLDDVSEEQKKILEQKKKNQQKKKSQSDQDLDILLSDEFLESQVDSEEMSILDEDFDGFKTNFQQKNLNHNFIKKQNVTQYDFEGEQIFNKVQAIVVEDDVDEGYDQDDFQQKLLDLYIQKVSKQKIIQSTKMQQEQQNKNKVHKMITDPSSSIGKWINFSNDFISYVSFPYYIVMIWGFYDQNLICNNYNITESQMIFYFLFMLIIIPFQLVVDIFFFNIVRQYHSICFLDYIKHLKQMFKERKKSWKTDEEYVDNKKLPNNQKSLDHWGFSAQYYLVTSLFLLALLLFNMALNTFIYHSYNPFNDQYTILILFFWLSIFKMIKYSCIFLGKKLKIWHVKQNQVYSLQQILKEKNIVIPEYDYFNQYEYDTVRRLKRNAQTIGETNYKLNLGQDQFQQQELDRKYNEKKYFKDSDWDIVLKNKEIEDKLKDWNKNMEKNQFLQEKFRKKFLIINRQWLKDNMKLIIQPAFNYSDVNNDAYSSVIRLNQIDKSKLDDSQIDYNQYMKDKIESNKKYYHEKQVEYRNLLLDKFNEIYGDIKYENYADEEDFQMDVIPKNIEINRFKITKKLSEPGKIILKYWLARCRHTAKIRSYIAGLLESQTLRYCQYCGKQHGLRADVSNYNIEDLYLKFIKDTGVNKNMIEWKAIDKWQNYFLKQGKFITSCFECNDVAMNNQIKIMEEEQKQIFLKQQQQADFYKNYSDPSSDNQEESYENSDVYDKSVSMSEENDQGLDYNTQLRSNKQIEGAIQEVASDYSNSEEFDQQNEMIQSPGVQLTSQMTEIRGDQSGRQKILLTRDNQTIENLLSPTNNSNEKYLQNLIKLNNQTQQNFSLDTVQEKSQKGSKNQSQAKKNYLNIQKKLFKLDNSNGNIKQQQQRQSYFQNSDQSDDSSQEQIQNSSRVHLTEEHQMDSVITNDYSQQQNGKQNKLKIKINNLQKNILNLNKGQQKQQLNTSKQNNKKFMLNLQQQQQLQDEELLQNNDPKKQNLFKGEKLKNQKLQNMRKSQNNLNDDGIFVQQL